ncbi:hypothetical protein D9757_012299 [Collybiopsis confluens]|uniref:Cytochrome P450 n=1 Tax=Collybiopsis confluens TaxID=2823264 RepID=A0A8H5G5X0_9AGAR|nr:hypothetical protein D9757_012299 [Collybiopsis confluens]
MSFPPGLAFLFRLAVPQAALLAAAYSVLHALHYHGYRLSTPTIWIVFIGVFLGRPIWALFLSNPYGRIRNTRRAADNGAVLPPLVDAPSSEVVATVVRSFGQGYLGEGFLEWANKYGNTYIYQAYSETRIMTLEPEHIKAILAIQFEHFEKGKVGYRQLKSLLGSGVFNSDGDMWKFHRNMTRPFFSKNRISDFDIFERHAEDAISAIRNRLAQGYPIEVQDAIGRFTLDSATEFLFGKDVESLGAGLPYPQNAALKNDQSFFDHPSNKFVRAFMKGQEQASARGRIGDLWPLAEFWEDKVGLHRQEIDKFTKPIIEERMRALVKKSGEDVKDEGETFLDHLLRSTDDKQVIKDELVNILVAGRDTTASLLTFATYILTQRPDLTKRLRKEILDFVGPNARPTYRNIVDMKYLRAFLNETLRLYPAVPFNSRYSKNPVILPGKNGKPPLYIPSGSKCVYSVFLMHRREDLWGPDVLEFDPGRFIDERAQKYLIPNPFIFVPFHAGPRICLGQQFAYNEASYFLIRFLQSFSSFEMDLDVQSDAVKPPKEWVPSPGTTKGRDKILLDCHLTMMVKGGLWIRMKEQDTMNLEDDV